MRWAMAAFYFAAGALHLAVPERFLPIVPNFVPIPHAVVLVTGLWILTRRLRRLVGIMLAIYAAFEGIQLPPIPDGWRYHGLRLIMQPVLVGAVLYASHRLAVAETSPHNGAAPKRGPAVKTPRVPIVHTPNSVSSEPGAGQLNCFSPRARSASATRVREPSHG
jgi:uncharacterized membrane protein